MEDTLYFGVPVPAAVVAVAVIVEGVQGVHSAGCSTVYGVHCAGCSLQLPWLGVQVLQGVSCILYPVSWLCDLENG